MMKCETCGYEHTEKNARKLWRKHGFGRLYSKRRYRGNNWLDSKFAYYARQGSGGMLMKDAGTVIHTALGIDE